MGALKDVSTFVRRSAASAMEQLVVASPAVAADALPHLVGALRDGKEYVGKRIA